MKAFLLYALLAGSLAINVLLGLGLRERRSQRVALLQKNVSDVEHGASSASEKSGRTNRSESNQATRLAGTIQGVDWQSISAGGDLATWVTRMRAAGFPARIIHATIWAEMTKR